MEEHNQESLVKHEKIGERLGEIKDELDDLQKKNVKAEQGIRANTNAMQQRSRIQTLTILMNTTYIS